MTVPNNSIVAQFRAEKQPIPAPVERLSGDIFSFVPEDFPMERKHYLWCLLTRAYGWGNTEDDCASFPLTSKEWSEIPDCEKARIGESPKDTLERLIKQH